MKLPRIDIDRVEFLDDNTNCGFVDGKVFTGIAVERWPTGELRSEVPYDAGLLHGPSRSWDEHGQLRDETYHCVGVLHGRLRTWDEHGQLTRDEIWEFYTRIWGPPPGTDQLPAESAWLAATDPALVERWRKERASTKPKPIIELVDDELVEVPWPFDDALPDDLRAQLMGPDAAARRVETTVAAHELDFPDPEAELRLIEMILPITIENIPTGRDNLGAAFDHARRWLGFRRALGKPTAQLVEALATIVELGVALFRRASFQPDETVSLTIGGARMDLPGAASYYNSAPRWADAVGAAMTLRDRDALEQLCTFDVAAFAGSYDRYHDVYAQAVIALETRSGDVDALLREAADLAAHAELAPERGQRLGTSLAELARAVVDGDEAAFNRQLADGLREYRTLHSSPPDKHEGALVVPLRYLGWAAAAHDRGLGCRLQSDYLPSPLVDGSFEA